MHAFASAVDFSAPPAPDGGSGRYEFRIFRPRLDPFAGLIDAITARAGSRASCDHYILLDGVLDAGLKLRDRALELKTLAGVEGPLERWTADGRVALPAQGRELAAVLARGGLREAPPDRSFADAPELARWLAGRPGVRVLGVRKRRQAYVLPEARAEITELEIGGRALRSLAVEGVDPAAVLRLVRRLGLPLRENTSYPRLLHGLLEG